jgi:uncharacterized membrane protein
MGISPQATHHLKRLQVSLTPTGEISMFTPSKGFQIASAAAALAFSAAAFAADAPAGSSGKAIAASDKVHCYGVHSCKGNSDCKTSENSCKGQNACKGHGFKAMAAAECLKAGGTIGDQ